MGCCTITQHAGEDAHLYHPADLGCKFVHTPVVQFATAICKPATSVSATAVGLTGAVWFTKALSDASMAVANASDRPRGTCKALMRHDSASCSWPGAADHWAALSRLSVQLHQEQHNPSGFGVVRQHVTPGGTSQASCNMSAVSSPVCCSPHRLTAPQSPLQQTPRCFGLPQWPQ